MCVREESDSPSPCCDISDNAAATTTAAAARAITDVTPPDVTELGMPKYRLPRTRRRERERARESKKKEERYFMRLVFYFQSPTQSNYSGPIFFYLYSYHHGDGFNTVPRRGVCMPGKPQSLPLLGFLCPCCHITGEPRCVRLQVH